MIDNINPQHYETAAGGQTWDEMQNVYGSEFVKVFCIGNEFKYIVRYDRKNGTEDIKKAIRYLEKYCELCGNE